ncbi:sterile alpha motif domain-containing 3 [Labeo rohita]|uniref:Sterile alpha motif domain-containing 3 n=1 Tax=Labeo rohita TaxID=84645 RepID=A0A498NJK6_LABRO|nr:sterile alpha motif domain-containing 3 [Labeo rohita]
MCIKKQTDSDSVFSTLKVIVDGTEYASGMFVSVGESGGLPKFAKILQIYLLFAEYQRVTNENLPNKFYAQLDYHLPRLMTLLRQKSSKTGKTADTLANLLKVHDEQELHDVNSRRTTVIRGLPVLLRDKDLGFFRTTLIDNPEVLTEDASVALLTVVHENAAAPIHYDPVRVSVVLENEMVTTHSQLPKAFLVLFGFMYALHLKYPKGLAKTFEFVQKVLLGMDDGKLSPSVQTLKNELM